MHVVAPLRTTPVPVPISATEPDGHDAHSKIADELYRPLAHIVHVVAPMFTTPVPTPTSAIEPAGHTTHALPACDENKYRPEGQRNAHATIEAILPRPAGQAVHVVAPLLTTPVPTPISAMEPAGQLRHDVADVLEGKN